MRQNDQPISIGNRLARNWGLVAGRGILAILFGLAALFLPETTLVLLVYLFGAFVLGGGILLTISAFRDRLDSAEGWLLLIEGILGIVIGVLIFALPGVATLALVYFIAAWAIVTGILEIITAIQLRKDIANEWLLALAGIASILFGAFLLFRPFAGVLTGLWIIGFYAVLFGVLQIILAFRLRHWSSRTNLSS